MIRAAIILLALATAVHAETNVDCGINLMRGDISNSEIELQCGLSREQVAALRTEHERTRAEIAMNRDLLLQILENTGRTAEALESGVSEAALIELARRVSEDVANVQQAKAELERAVSIAIQVQLGARDNPSTDEFVAEVERRLAELSGAGKLDEAAAEASRALALWEAEQANQRKRGLRLLEVALEQDILRRDAEAAASRIVRMAELQASQAFQFDDLRQIRREWRIRGLEKGLLFDQEVSIELALIEKARALGPDELGTALNDLGISLQELGKREPGTARMEQAVVAFRAALEVGTRERVPLDWAGTQMNLGNVLQTLGQRAPGTARLKEAIAAYRAALEEWTRARVPLQWAMAQMNLGNALQTLGERTSGTARLEEAVVAFNAALEERTRARMPLDWANTQMNLGNALAILGTREPGTVRLEQAVTAYRAALEEQTRERVPLQWAFVQANLARVELAFFEKTADLARLDAAELNMRRAREVFVQAQAKSFIDRVDNVLANIAGRRP